MVRDRYECRHCGRNHAPTVACDTVTYPVVFMGGVREASATQVDRLKKKVMTPDERIAELEQRVASIEKLVRYGASH